MEVLTMLKHLNIVSLWPTLKKEILLIRLIGLAPPFLRKV